MFQKPSLFPVCTLSTWGPLTIPVIFGFKLQAKAAIGQPVTVVPGSQRPPSPEKAPTGTWLLHTMRGGLEHVGAIKTP